MDMEVEEEKVEESVEVNMEDGEGERPAPFDYPQLDSPYPVRLNFSQL